MRHDVYLHADPAIECKLDHILTALEHLKRQGEVIMSAISNYIDKQNAYNSRIGAAIDGIVADVKALNVKIDELQDSAGTVTPEDQALIDQAQAAGDALAAKAEALDAQTPPTAPPV